MNRERLIELSKKHYNSLQMDGLRRELDHEEWCTLHRTDEYCRENIKGKYAIELINEVIKSKKGESK